MTGGGDAGSGASAASQTLRVLVVAVGFFFGALFAVGSLIAVRFEMEGFPPRPGQPRGWYLALLALALAASVTTPFVLLRFLLPDTRAPVKVLAVVAVLLAVVLFGISVR